MPLRGLVLAGGKSSRFGSDKSQAVFEGTTLLDRAVKILSDLDLKPVVATRKGIEISTLKCVTIQDKLPEKGPLGGIYTAMSVFKGTTFLVLTCDMPWVRKEILLTLLKAHEDHEGATVFSLNGVSEPFPGIYGPFLYPQICAHFFEDCLSMGTLLKTYARTKILPWDGDLVAFKNINYKKDLPDLNLLNS